MWRCRISLMLIKGGLRGISTSAASTPSCDVPDMRPMILVIIPAGWGGFLSGSVPEMPAFVRLIFPEPFSVTRRTVATIPLLPHNSTPSYTSIWLSLHFHLIYQVMFPPHCSHIRLSPLLS